MVSRAGTGRTGLRPRLVTTAAFAGVMLALSVAPLDAHFPSIQGTTRVDPTNGAPGTAIKASGTGAQQGYPYSLMFADPSQVSSFEQGGGHEGHKEACAHGSPIGGPFTADGNGNIAPVEATIPPSSPGRALICFETGNTLTRPVNFTVNGWSYMQPPPGGGGSQPPSGYGG
jgi:hypothetical protein